MADLHDLGWYERMAQRSRARARVQKEREDAQERDLQKARDAVEQMQGRQQPEYAIGPPHSCHECYTWERSPVGGITILEGSRVIRDDPIRWHWCHTGRAHVEVDGGEMRDDDDIYRVDICRHDCHGPDALLLPVIAIA